MLPGGLISAGGWVNYQCEDAGIKSVHVVPRCDLHEHHLDADGTCPCMPVADLETPDFWTHQAFDGREDYESPAPGLPPRRRRH